MHQDQPTFYFYHRSAKSIYIEPKRVFNIKKENRKKRNE